MEALDELNIRTDEKIKKHLKKQPDEKIYYSNTLTKINKAESYQTRIILITDFAVYNIKKKDIRRFIPIANISAITISTISNEFVIHESNSYDIRYETDQRELLLKYLIYVFQKVQNRLMPIHFIENKVLSQYTTLEADVKKKITKRPQSECFSAKFQELNIFFSNKLLKEQNASVLYINYDTIFRVWIDDFKAKYILAEGSYSKIYLCIYNGDNNKLFALKHLKASQLGKYSIEEMQNEIVTHNNTPFVESLEFAFRQNDEFFLFFKLMKVYNDLKPENVLIDLEGHVYLTDYGCSRCIEVDGSENLHTTLEYSFQIFTYTAPEQFYGAPKSFKSDFWALGNLLYEMIVGIAPFYNENEKLVMHLITQNQLHFPSQESNIKISEECKSMITQLLNPDPALRLNYEQIQSHPWLKGVEWPQYENLLIKAPWKPEIKEKTYINNKYFDYTKIKETPISKLVY